MRDLYHSLDRDLDWTMTQTTSGEAHVKVKSVVPGRGFDMYRNLSQWYMLSTAGTVHEVITPVLSPSRAAKEEDVGVLVEKCAETLNILTQLDPTAAEVPDTYQNSALRMILCGTINTHVDLKSQDQVQIQIQII